VPQSDQARCADHQRDGGIGHAGVLIPLLAGIALLGVFIAWAARPGDRHPGLRPGLRPGLARTRPAAPDATIDARLFPRLWSGSRPGTGPLTGSHHLAWQEEQGWRSREKSAA
jgi:hypothetical protein